jgi:hypothetical protein
MKPGASNDRKKRRHALKYTVIGDELYRRTIDRLLLKCLDEEQAKVAMGDVHEGICGSHQSAHKMRQMIKRAGPTGHLSYPVFKSKPNAHSVCAQESSLHTYHTENGYTITNVTIYSIYYRIMSLQKTMSNTLKSIAAERHHNSTGNRPEAIACLEHHIEVLQIFFNF